MLVYDGKQLVVFFFSHSRIAVNAIICTRGDDICLLKYKNTRFPKQTFHLLIKSVKSQGGLYSIPCELNTQVSAVNTEAHFCAVDSYVCAKRNFLVKRTSPCNPGHDPVTHLFNNTTPLFCVKEERSPRANTSYSSSTMACFDSAAGQLCVITESQDLLRLCKLCDKCALSFKNNNNLSTDLWSHPSGFDMVGVLGGGGLNEACPDSRANLG